jgi:predicted ATPase/DNA-binding XRE family transcriptional regulator
VTTSPPPDFAPLLRQLRRERGLTQEELAARAGLSLGAVSYLERGLTQTPQRETVRLLAQALALDEREEAALSRAARAAHTSVMGAIETPAASVNGKLPEPLTALIGRAVEIEEITLLLGQDRARLLTLTGAAGVGKTRLAIEAARRWPNQRSVVFVGLAIVQEPERVLPALAEALHVQSSSAQPLRDILVAAMRDRDVLLVIDNFEQVLSAARDIANLLGACPRVKALVTSRVALNVRGEREYPVAPLALPDASHGASASALEAYASVWLFLERARDIRPDFALSAPDDTRRMVEICARLDGLPLAIELAAAQVRHASLAELHHRLTGDAPLNALSGGAQDLADHQRAMRSTIAWSYSLLGAEEQRVFRALSVFAGGATIEGVAAVTGLELDAVVQPLDALVDQSMLFTTRASESTRYTQLVTLRAFGLERLAEAGDQVRVQARHATYYATLVEGEWQRLARCEPETMALLGQEHENIRAALSWALATRDANAIWTGLRLAGALWFWWEIRGFLVEGLDWLERLSDLAQPPETDAARVVLARVWSGIMGLSYRLGRFERACEAGERALALRRQLDDMWELAEALNNQGIVAAGVRRYTDAEALYRESIALYAQAGYPSDAFKPLLNLGLLKRDLRQHAEALALFHESLRVAEQTTAQEEARAILWNNIGDLHTVMGEPALASSALERAEAMFARLDSTWGVAMSAHDRGRAAFGQGDVDEAMRQLIRAVTMREELGDRAGASLSRYHQARVCLSQGDLGAAAQLLASALSAYMALRLTDPLWAVIEGTAALACAREHFEPAARLYATAIPRRDALLDVIEPTEYARRAADLAAIRASLGDARSRELFSDAPPTSLDDALALARSELA